MVRDFQAFRGAADRDRVVWVCGVCIAVASFGVAAPVEGQVVRGRVLEAYTDQPVGSARVALIAASGQPAATAVADSAGLFSLTAPGRGMYQLYADKIGYLSGVDGPFELATGDTIRVQFRLELHPIVGDSLIVEVRQRDRRLTNVGFYDRMRSTLGRFITPEQIQRRNAIWLTDLFRGIPGAIVIGGEVFLNYYGRSFSQGGRCYPRVYLDGMVMAPGGPDYPAMLSTLVSPHDVAGIEVYRRPPEIPVQYGGPMSGCGVILIWTHSGPAL